MKHGYRQQCRQSGPQESLANWHSLILPRPQSMRRQNRDGSAKLRDKKSAIGEPIALFSSTLSRCFFTGAFRPIRFSPRRPEFLGVSAAGVGGRLDELLLVCTGAGIPAAFASVCLGRGLGPRASAVSCALRVTIGFVTLRIPGSLLLRLIEGISAPPLWYPP